MKEPRRIVDDVSGSMRPETTAHMVVDVLNAMGWSGIYPHCQCCDDGCKMKHYAPCVNRACGQEEDNG